MALTPRPIRYTCPECGGPLIHGGPKVTGASCHKGCGGLYPKLPLPVQRRNHAISSMGLQDVQRAFGGTYTLPGNPQAYRKVRKITAVVLSRKEAMIEDDEILALDGTDLLVLSPVTMEVK